MSIQKMNFITPGYEDMELSTQILIKEAIKRRVKVKILDREENFIQLEKEGRVENVKEATKTSKDPYSTFLIMENKVVTKKILQSHNIRVPEGNVFSDKENAFGAYEAFKGQDIVIKPKNTNFGVGVTMLNKGAPREAFREAVKEAFKHDGAILVEEMLHGKEYRFLIINDRVTAVLHRVPANVTGNGVKSIAELVEEKNQNPLRGKGYKRPLEKITLGKTEIEYLKLRGYTAGSVPPKEEQVFLRENSNISTGGDSLDFTDIMPHEYKQIAVNAARAVGAKICGADIIIKDFKEAPLPGNHGIIELNFNPAIHIHSFPFRGENRHPGKAVLDLLGFKEEN